MEQPTPLREDESQEAVSGPPIGDWTKCRTLFSMPPKTGQWIPWIEQLLSDVPITQIVQEIDHLLALCDQASTVFGAEPNTLNLNLDDSDHFVLVGDVHGQFKDLAQHVLVHQWARKNEGQSDLKFLFLGDYVDRGPQSAEVLTLLLCLKVEYPSLVHMIRGNHEEFQTCRIYGFSHECQSKFKDPKVFHKFNVVFTQLPLASVLTTKAGSIFACHGGLSPGLTHPQTIDFIDRTEYEGGVDDSGDVVDGLLWSDPCESGTFRQNARGCGYLFGPDATKAFLETNGLKFIVRAHQLAMAGFAWEHNKKVLTIFSAPNYCGVNNNKGAVLFLHGSEPTFNESDIHTYDAVVDAPPLFSSTTAKEVPAPDAARLNGGYFEDGSELMSSPGLMSSPTVPPQHKRSPGFPAPGLGDPTLL